MPFVAQHEVPTPTDDWMVVLVRPEKVTPGGVVVPESAYDELPTVEVLAVGPGIRSMFTGQPIPMDVRPGDVIYVIPHFVILGKVAEEKPLVEVPKLVLTPAMAPTPEPPPPATPKLAFLQRKSVMGWKSRAPQEVTNA